MFRMLLQRSSHKMVRLSSWTVVREWKGRGEIHDLLEE